MAIFRCFDCEKIFDLSEQHPEVEVPHCKKCGEIMMDRWKPKRKEYSDNPYEKPNPKIKNPKKTKRNGK
jgi:DNA-directed RNA polymerase subunit RPC12/RpoP